RRSTCRTATSSTGNSRSTSSSSRGRRRGGRTTARRSAACTSAVRPAIRAEASAAFRATTPRGASSATSGNSGATRMGFRGAQAARLLPPALVFLALWFVAPLLRLFSLAFTDPTGPWASFATLIGSPVYRQVFFNTLLVAVYVTVICVLLAYSVAWLLSRLKGTWYVVALYCVLFPLWISVLVRTFSWM